MASENVSKIHKTKHGDCGSVSTDGNKIQQIQHSDQKHITSMFMRLPLELRREIYKLVLGERFPFSYEVAELEDLFVANICNRYHSLRHLLLNRQVCYEALESVVERDTVRFYNHLTTTSDRKLQHPEYQPKLMPFNAIRRLELIMHTDGLNRYRAPTLGFLELCTNLQHLLLHFGIRFEIHWSTLIINGGRVIFLKEAEKLEMTETISRRWMLFFDLQSLMKATALQTLNISLETPFIHGLSELASGRVVEEVIKRIKEILPSSVQFKGEVQAGVISIDGSEFHRYK